MKLKLSASLIKTMTKQNRAKWRTHRTVRLAVALLVNKRSQPRRTGDIQRHNPRFVAVHDDCVRHGQDPGQACREENGEFPCIGRRELRDERGVDFVFWAMTDGGERPGSVVTEVD